MNKNKKIINNMFTILQAGNTPDRYFSKYVWMVKNKIVYC